MIMGFYDRQSQEDYARAREQGYEEGFMAGIKFATKRRDTLESLQFLDAVDAPSARKTRKSKGKLSKYNKFVKANASKPRFRYKSGADKGKVNFKKLGIAWRKTAEYKKSKKNKR
jgi:hypothetical protein